MNEDRLPPAERIVVDMHSPTIVQLASWRNPHIQPHRRHLDLFPGLLRGGSSEMRRSETGGVMLLGRELAIS